MNAVTIEFDEVAHAYSVNGQRYPSVTQVLALLEDFGGIDAATLAYARLRGQHVHAAMALLVRGELDWQSLDSELTAYINGGHRFLLEAGVTVIASECRVADTRLRLAGTLDLVGHWRDTECIFDFKGTCATVPPSVGPQTAAYERLYQSRYGGASRRRFCVQLSPGNYRVTELKDKNDWSIFQSALNCHRWMDTHHAARRTRAA